MTMPKNILLNNSIKGYEIEGIADSYKIILSTLMQKLLVTYMQ